MSKELTIPTNGLKVYQCDKVDIIIKQIEDEARSIVPDLETATGRRNIASLARKVSSSKVALDDLGIGLVAGWKAKSKLVDAERKIIRDRLDALRVEIRQPLTDWEEAEKAKAAAIQAAEKLLNDHLEALTENDLFDRQREVERKEAEQERLEQERKEKAEAEALEAARIEQEKQAEIDRLEREKQIAIDAAKAADDAAQAKIQAAEDAQKAAERESIEAATREKIAKENAAILAEQARQAEIDRQNAEVARLNREKAKLEADKKHVGKIRGAAKECLLKFVDEPTAKKIVLAISKDEIDNVTINY